MGDSTTTLFAAPRLTRRLKSAFPKPLTVVPFRMPSEKAAIRRSLEGIGHSNSGSDHPNPTQPQSHPAVTPSTDLLPSQAPNMNAVAERFVGSVKRVLEQANPVW